MYLVAGSYTSITKVASGSSNTGLSDEEATEYLLSRTPPSSGSLNLIAAEPMKLLNLGADWLSALLPHVFGRTSRVNFGLLAPDQITDRMPKNRKLLAVPFVGKDVPSKVGSELVSCV